MSVLIEDVMISFIFENLIFFVAGYLLLHWYTRKLINFTHLHLVCISLVFSITSSIFLEVCLEGLWNEPYPENYADDLPVILWWTPSVGNDNTVRQCYNKYCLISHNRSLIDKNVSKAFAFYGSNIDIADLPLPRNNTFWALLHEESPKNLPLLYDDNFLVLFNFTSTFSRASHFPLNALYLNSLNDIKDFKYYVPVANKSKLLKEIGLVLYIQSDCDTLTDRDTYVAKLGEYIKVDSYGSCLNDAELPENLKNNSDIYSEDFLQFVAKYHYHIAIENAVCDDYITEKLWRPLIVGSIPIYFGSPNVRDWLPNYDSTILVSDFENPQKLAEFLLKASAENIYNSMIAHKIKGNINNLMLKRIMKSRRWTQYQDSYKYGNFVEEFECRLCSYLHDDIMLSKKTDRSHYSCSLPYSMLTGKKNDSNHWNDILKYAKCQGKVLSEFISKNVRYTEPEIDIRINELLSRKEC